MCLYQTGIFAVFFFCLLFLLLLMLLLLLLLFWGDGGTVGFQKKALVPAEVPTATGCYLLIIQCVGQ